MLDFLFGFAVATVLAASLHFVLHKRLGRLENRLSNSFAGSQSAIAEVSSFATKKLNTVVTDANHRICSKCGKLVARYNEAGVCANCEVEHVK